jgi:hypothetical protein
MFNIIDSFSGRGAHAPPMEYGLQEACHPTGPACSRRLRLQAACGTLVLLVLLAAAGLPAFFVLAPRDDFLECLVINPQPQPEGACGFQVAPGTFDDDLLARDGVVQLGQEQASLAQQARPLATLFLEAFGVFAPPRPQLDESQLLGRDGFLQATELLRGDLLAVVRDPGDRLESPAT